MGCFACKTPLVLEKPDFVTHHHGHTGSINDYSCYDSLLVPLCLKCHNDFHRKEDKFNLYHGLDDDEWLKKAVKCLSKYVEALNLNPHLICLKAMTEAVKPGESNEVSKV